MHAGGRFQPGNPGRPRGAKGRALPAEIRRRAIVDNADEYLAVMTTAARSRRRSDQRWFADQYRRLLPKETAVSVLDGDKQLVLVVPAAGTGKT